MNKIALALILVASMLFVGCTTTTPNVSASVNPFPLQPLKIKRWTPITYEYEISENGCSEIEFLKTFVGRSVKTDDGPLHVDNIIDIHSNVVDKQISFAIFKSERSFKCSFWGVAVEVEK